VLSVFNWLAATGGVAEGDMLRTFNCGVGMVIIAESAKADGVAAALEREGENVTRLGNVVARAEGAPQVAYDGRLDLAW
jgi:phosphoribosylformylglycinamidine cyclo-ligase